MLLLTNGCAAAVGPSIPPHLPRSAIVVDPVETAFCVRTTELGYAQLDEPLEEPELLSELVGVPADVRRVARAAGLERTLLTLQRTQATGPAEQPIDLVAVRLELITRISTLEIEVASLRFEVECTGEQIEALELKLARQSRRQQMALIIASTTVAATAGISAGLWNLSGTESNGPAILGIGGGATSATLGFAALAPGRGRVVVAHERNLARPVLAGEDPQRLYPPFVFRLLNASLTAGGPTPREQLLAEWRRIIHDRIPAPEMILSEAVLYSAGGVYDGRLVSVRKRMYEAIESQLDAIEHDLGVLDQYVSHYPSGRQAVHPRQTLEHQLMTTPLRARRMEDRARGSDQPQPRHRRGNGKSDVGEHL